MSAVRLYEQLIQAKGLTSRSSQLKMIASLDQHFNLENQEASQVNQIMIEAPTGVGKSIAYLVAALPQLEQEKVVFIISTATKILQSQLINKDIPDVLGSLNLPYRAEIVKGRENYLCLAKLDDKQPEVVKGIDSYIQEQVYVKLNDKTWDGDLNQLDGVSSSEQGSSSLLGSDAHSCRKNTCQFADNCYLYKKKKQISNAKILVTNHTMLASIVNSASPKLSEFLGLAEGTKIILCIDEAHNFADKYRDVSKDNLNLTKLVNSIENHHKIFSDLLIKYPAENSNDSIGLAINSLNTSLNELIHQCASLSHAQLISTQTPFLITPQITPPETLLRIGLDYAHLDNLCKTIASDSGVIYDFFNARFKEIRVGDSHEIRSEQTTDHKISQKREQFLTNLSRIIELYQRITKLFSKVNVTNEKKPLNYGVWIALDQSSCAAFNICYSEIEVADKIKTQLYN